MCKSAVFICIISNNYACLKMVLLLLQLEGIDISDNKLYSLSEFASITSKAPNVVNLNVGKNKVFISQVFICVENKILGYKH